MATPDPTLDDLLVQLAQAQAEGASDDELATIRKEITLAGNREAAARQVAAVRAKPAGPRLAGIAPYRPRYTPTSELQGILNQFRSALGGSGLAPHVDFLVAHAEPFIALQIDDGANPDELSLGASRFGYVPDLPPTVPWPAEAGKRLPFLAQLDLSTFPHYPGSLLPEGGWLYAFASLPDQITPGNPWRYAIIYLSGPRESLVRQSATLSNDDFWPTWGEHPYDLVTLQPKLAIDIDPQVVQHRLSPDELMVLREILEPLLPFSNDSYGDIGFAGHLLGQSGDCNDETATDSVNSLIQSNLHPVATRVSNQPEGPGDDWIHLLSLRSVGSMEWCDSGFLYFLIRRRDLAGRNFENVVLSLCTS